VTTQPSIKAIIFDLGGVLIQVYEEERFRVLEAEWGLSPGQVAEVLWRSPEHRLAEVGTITDAEYWRRITPRLGLHTTEAVRAFQQGVFGPVEVTASMVELVRRLHGPYRTGLVSNASDTVTPAFIADRYGLGGLFDVEIVSALVGLAKPDPAIYRLALERLGTAPEATIFVDDYPTNVDAAAALGIQAIHFTGYEELIAELEQRGVA
jgi:epoxide hydrolase-like predicted phosphatase